MATPEHDMSDTSIRVSDELADELFSRKRRGESYEDVLWRELEKADAFSKIDDGDVLAAVERAIGEVPEEQREHLQHLRDVIHDDG